MKNRRPNGFTLIEVLMAMTLLSIMVVLLFSSLRIAAESWNAGESKAAEVNKKAVVYQFFKRHLSAIRPLPMSDRQQDFSPDNQQTFQGFPERLRFVGALPAASLHKGLQLFTVAPEPDDSSILAVVLKPYRQTEAGTETEPSRPEVLLDGVESLRFSYFGRTEDIADLQWRDEWTLADRLPSLIKVVITLKDGSYWPEMVFAPKITQTIGGAPIDGDFTGDVLEPDDAR